MSTYYQYQDVSVMIAHKLMNMEGWKVYGYHADESDSMTDYYSPAYWNGVAEKNGYIFVYNCGYAAKPEEIRQYKLNENTTSQSSYEKIQKLKQMTVERGASEAEAETARNMIEKLQAKQSEITEKYTITGIKPGHMANPPRCNWHIEKDGMIISKGSGLLKYSAIDDYYRHDRCMDDLNAWKKDEEQYIKDYVRNNMHRWNDTEERAKKSALSHIEELKKDDALIKQFEVFINKIDTTCGCLVGDGDLETYEKVIVTEYKKEIKAKETEGGTIKDGQCFIVKTDFNYGHNKGYVYRIKATEYNGKTSYHAVKLNGKLTKECTGTAARGNYWYMSDNFTRWFDKGSLAWCELQEVKTPYEVEKVVKKTVKAENKPVQKSTTEVAEETNTTINGLHFELSEDIDTRTNDKIYLVKVVEKLSREDYIKVNQYIKSIGGYYSKFKHAFLFQENPTELLNAKQTETNTEEATQKVTEETQTETEKETVKYNIEEDVHTKTGEKIYIVKPDTELNKQDFAEVKRKLATLQGFYSGFKHGFIFKYDPTEKLTTA